MNDSSSAKSESQTDTSNWKEIVARYQKPSVGRAVWQIANTVGSYVVLWYLMYLSLAVSYWLVVALAILAGAFFWGAFVHFHDGGPCPLFQSSPGYSNVLATHRGL